MTPTPAREAPIGVFDSGVGGLTVLHECLVSLPEEDYLYLGDDARFPYGAKSQDELRDCVERDTRFLLERGAKLIVIACNSAATAGLETARTIAAREGSMWSPWSRPSRRLRPPSRLGPGGRARDAGHGRGRGIPAVARGQHRG